MGHGGCAMTGGHFTCHIDVVTGEITGSWTGHLTPELMAALHENGGELLVSENGHTVGFELSTTIRSPGRVELAFHGRLPEPIRLPTHVMVRFVVRYPRPGAPEEVVPMVDAWTTDDAENWWHQCVAHSLKRWR